MAINEELIGEVRPSESAVERLRKRNRIRPWEGNLVGTQTISKTPLDTGNSPPGQSTQGGGEPVDTFQKTEPMGNSSSGLNDQGVPSLVGGAATANSANEKEPSLSHESPPGLGHQGVNQRGGNSPTGSAAARCFTPPESNTSAAGHSLGVLIEERLAQPSGHSIQRLNNPDGVLPRGQDTLGQPLNGFDPTRFVPVNKGVILWREKGCGELRIPHRLYEFAHRVTSTRNELLVFDCLLRFSLGFHRSWCEAGYSFIAAWTGINDYTNIKKSLKTLIGAGIIVKTKEHDSVSNSGSVYEIPVVKGYLEFVATKNDSRLNEKSDKHPEGERPTGFLPSGGVSPPARGQKTFGPVGDLPPKKERINKTSKKTLSQENSQSLDSYVDQIKPASKRESEIHFLGKLLSEYSSNDVTMALNYIRRFGALGSGERCHSPLKYLSSAIEQVLPKALELEPFIRTLCQEQTTQKDESSAENESQENHLRATARSAFETELQPAEQDRYLAEVTRENSIMGYAPPIGVLRNMAALKWFCQEC